MTLTLTLPWPPRDLSPNARLHWAKLAKAKKSFRFACWLATREQMRAQRIRLSHVPSRIALAVQFVRPDRRGYDRDNLLARMKAGLDGLASALDFDDRQIEAITFSVADEPVKGGEVRITLSALAGQPTREANDREESCSQAQNP